MNPRRQGSGRLDQELAVAAVVDVVVAVVETETVGAVADDDIGHAAWAPSRPMARQTKDCHHCSGWTQYWSCT